MIIAVLLTAIGGLATSASASAANLPSEISENMTLLAAGEPYTGSPTIEPGVTLVIKPGTQLDLNSLTVRGSLLAEGTTEAPISFSSESSRWNGIFFEPGSGASVLDHVEVAKAGERYGTGTAISVTESSPTIVHSTIKESVATAIAVYGGSPQIAFDSIDEANGMGIYFTATPSQHGEINIHDNVVEKVHDGIFLTPSEEATIVVASLGGNTLREDQGEPLHDYGGPIAPDITTNTVVENPEGNFILLGGRVEGSETWDDPGVPLKIWRITVAHGATLNLGPGLEAEGGEWKVNGTMKAEGEAADPVIFTPQGSSRWNGIFFEPGSGASVLDHVEVIRGGSHGGAAVTVDSASPTITHATIKSSGYYGILVKHGGSPDIGNNHIEDSVSSAVFYGEAEGESGEIDIHDNVLERNGGSAALLLTTGTNIAGGTLGGNTLRENSASTAVYFSGGEVPPDLADNKLIANNDDSIYVSGTVAESGSWSDPGGPIHIGSLAIAPGVTLSVQPGVAFEGGEIVVKGTLNALGEEEAPILFDPSGGNSWAGLTFETGSGGSQLEYVEFVKGGRSSGGAIAIEGASPSITNSTIRESANYGIYVSEGSPTIEGDRFRANPYAVVYEGEGKLAAHSNDWGCKGGPGTPGCDPVVNVEWKPSVTLPELPHPCVAGSRQPGPSLNCLLYRYAPELKYDDQESYLANSAAEITDNWGDESGLWGEGESGGYTNTLLHPIGPLDLIAAFSRPNAGAAFHLTLESLGLTYPNGEPATEEEWLDEAGENYAEDDHKLVAEGYLNRSYARVVRDGGGVWLQYWYFYYYNSFELESFGLHEGDWEEIQIGLDEEMKPDVLLLSEHKGGATCKLGEFQQNETGAPVVYVALDSHANYPKAGQYEDPLPSPLSASDHANGRGPAITPSVEIIGEEGPSWVQWPGHWGNSRGGGPGEEASPVGPMQHPQWNPEAFVESTHGCFDTYQGPDEWGERGGRAMSKTVAAPVIGSTGFKGKHPTVSYELPGGGRKESGSRLILSVEEKGSDLPPLTKTVQGPLAEGKTTLPFKMNPEREVVVFASVVDHLGHRSPVVRQVLR